MSADEYASKELQQWRKQEAKKDIEVTECGKGRMVGKERKREREYRFRGEEKERKKEKKKEWEDE